MTTTFTFAGTVQTAAGAAAAGTVSIQPMYPSVAGGVPIAQSPVTLNLDNTGSFTTTLYVINTYYQVVVQPTGGTASTYYLPGSGLITNLSTLSANGTPPVLPSIGLTLAQYGVPNGVATLDSTGKIPAAQVPASVYLPAPSGDATGATDRAVIQAAIDGAGTGRDVVFTGMYVINAAIKLKPGRRYVGLGSAYDGDCGVRQAAGANIIATGSLSGLLVANAWATDATSCDNPIIVENLAVDGNVGSNPSSTACGIVLTNFGSRIEKCYVFSTPKHGIYMTDTTQNGSTVVSNSCSENKVLLNRIQQPGGHGIAQISASGTSNQDGYCEGNLICAPGQDGINFGRASGWLFRRNHIYPLTFGGSVAGNGIFLDNAYCTVVDANEIESFGDTNALNAFYQGINVYQLTGRGTVISNNFVGCNEARAVTSNFQYIAVQAKPGATNAWVDIHDNLIQGPASFTGFGVAIVLDRQSGTGTLKGTCHSNSIDSVNTKLFNGGTGTYVTVTVRSNPGLNPRGVQTPPSVPASTTALTNPFNSDAMVNVTGGTVTVIAVGGTSVGATSGWVRVPANQTITLTYSVAPSWVWLVE